MPQTRDQPRLAEDARVSDPSAGALAGGRRAPAADAGPTGPLAGPTGPTAAPAAGLDGYRAAQLADALRIAAWLSIAAGLIHAIAMIDHFSHYWLFGVFFLVLTYGQVLWGIALLRGRATEQMLRSGVLANLAIVAIWLVSRTAGLPFGPNAGDPEAVGPMDVAATLDQLVLVSYVALLLVPELRDGRLRALIGCHRMRFGIMLCSASVFTAMLGGHQH
jgi:hypothetical protein